MFQVIDEIVICGTKVSSFVGLIVFYCLVCFGCFFWFVYGSISLVCVLIENVGLEMWFVVAFHHMGRFERNKGLKYVGGEIHVVKGIDPDFCSYFETLGIVKEFKYEGDVKLWWKGSKQKLLNNL